METPITIHNFRNEVDETALERGYIYFSNGWVKGPKEILPGYFEAVVEEANPHAVTYSVNERGEFHSVFCTCGDTKHEFCRHMAAILFTEEKKEIEANRPADWDRIEEDSLAPFRSLPRKKKKP